MTFLTRPVVTLLAMILASLTPMGALAACKLSVGWESWEPYSFMKDDTLTGVDIDVIRSVARIAHCDLDFKELPWTRILELIKRGELDATVTASRTPEREQFARFSPHYREEKVVLFVRAGDIDRFTLASLADIPARNMRLGVVRDYDYGPGVTEAQKQPAFQASLSYSSDLLNFRKLLAGHIEGLLIDLYAGANFIHQNHWEGKFAVHPLPINSGTIHVLLSKRSVSDDTAATVNQAIGTLRTSGELDAILKRYSAD